MFCYCYYKIIMCDKEYRLGVRFEEQRLDALVILGTGFDAGVVHLWSGGAVKQG